MEGLIRPPYLLAPRFGLSGGENMNPLLWLGFMLPDGVHLGKIGANFGLE